MKITFHCVSNNDTFCNLCTIYHNINIFKSNFTVVAENGLVIKISVSVGSCIQLYSLNTSANVFLSYKYFAYRESNKKLLDKYLLYLKKKNGDII